MSKDLNRILASDDKKVKEATNELALLYRQMLADLNITTLTWYPMVVQYFKSRYSRTRKNAVDIGQDRNNFNRALAKPRISWANFMQFLKILRPVKIEIIIRLHWKDETYTDHTLPIENQYAQLGETDIRTQPPEIPRD